MKSNCSLLLRRIICKQHIFAKGIKVLEGEFLLMCNQQIFLYEMCSKHMGRQLRNMRPYVHISSMDALSRISSVPQLNNTPASRKKCSQTFFDQMLSQ